MPRSAPRTKIAAVGTLAALGALAAVATASNPARRQQAPAQSTVAAVRAAPPKPVVVHRTVGVLTRFVPAPASAAARPVSTETKQKTAAVATPAAVTPARARTSPKSKAEPASSTSDDAADLPAPGVTEDECLPVTVGGAPQGTTAGAPAGVAVASSRADRRAARRARRRAERRARRHARKNVRGGRPLRTSNPLPEDVPGGVVDGCGLATVPTQADAPPTTVAPAAGTSTVVGP